MSRDPWKPHGGRQWVDAYSSGDGQKSIKKLLVMDISHSSEEHCQSINGLSIVRKTPG